MEKEKEIVETVEKEKAPESESKLTVDEVKAIAEKAISDVAKEKLSRQVDKSNLPTIEKPVDKNLNQIMRKHLNEIKSKGINIEGATSSGNTVSVPAEFASELAKLLDDNGILRRYGRTIPMSARTMTLNVLDGEAEASWTSQGSAKDGTNDTFRDVTFTRHTLAFIKTVSNELLQDAGYDLAQELLEISKDAFMVAEDTATFVGTGSPITGLTVVAGTNEIELDNQFSNSLTYGKIVDMVFATSGAKTGNEKLFMHPSVWAKVRQLEDTNGNLIGAGQSLLNPSFEGVPVVFVNSMTPASTDTTGSSYIVYGDLNKVWFANRNEFNMQASDQATVELNDGATTVNCFQQNCTAFRFEEAVDIQVVHPSAFSVLRSAH